MTYITKRSEYKGHPILEFHEAESPSKFPVLAVGLKKCQVIRAILESEELSREVLEFVSEEDKEETTT